MLKFVENLLDKYSLLNKDKTILVGLSGGADSVCLSDIAYKLSLEFGFKLVFCHLNHNWRGEHSKSDMEFCINFAKERNVEILTDILSKDEKQTETNARELRYKFFENCKNKTKAEVLLLAHNKNDRVETLVYRMIKGTGIRGLVSIKEKRDYILRPLINISRKEIEEYCTTNGLKYVTDNTNFDNDFNRNYIRNEILPKFEKINPKFIDAINNLSIIAEENERIIEEVLNKTKQNILEDNKISTEYFLGLSNEIKKRIILDIFLENDIDYCSKKINEILEFINENSDKASGIKYSLTNDLWLLVSKKYIETISKTEKSDLVVNITKEGTYRYSDYVFKIEKYNGEKPKTFPKDEKGIAYVEIKEPINFTLRSRQEGDFIQPLGLKGTQKLKKYLNTKKIKEHERNGLLFLCKGSEILWAPKYGLNEKFKVVSKPNYVISLEKSEEHDVGFTS